MVLNNKINAYFSIMVNNVYSFTVKKYHFNIRSVPLLRRFQSHPRSLNGIYHWKDCGEKRTVTHIRLIKIITKNSNTIFPYL